MTLDEIRRQAAIDVFKQVLESGMVPLGAPQHLIWSVITKFSAYPKWIDGLAETQVYRQEGSVRAVSYRTDVCRELQVLRPAQTIIG